MNDTSNTTNAASQSDIPQSVSDFMRHITDLCGGEHARWAENFNAGFANTLTTTVRRHDDGTTFLLTGDIPAHVAARLLSAIPTISRRSRR